MKFKVLWIAGLILAATAGHVQAGIITFTHTGSGSGSIGGSVFASSAFTITGVGDTSSRGLSMSGYQINHTLASIDIVGMGLFTFITATETFTDGFGGVGFKRVGGSDLYDGGGPVGLWDMLTSIGPVSGASFLTGWAVSPVNTTGGVLNFDPGSTSGTFEAVVGGGTAVPEPASFAILCIGAVGLVFARRKRQQMKLAV